MQSSCIQLFNKQRSDKQMKASSNEVNYPVLPTHWLELCETSCCGWELTVFKVAYHIDAKFLINSGRNVRLVGGASCFPLEQRVLFLLLDESLFEVEAELVWSVNTKTSGASQFEESWTQEEGVGGRFIRWHTGIVPPRSDRPPRPSEGGMNERGPMSAPWCFSHLVSCWAYTRHFFRDIESKWPRLPQTSVHFVVRY